MAEILLAGITHYPPLGGRDENMADLIEFALADPSIPDDVKDPASWPTLMQQEWGADRGTTAAAGHRAELVEGLRTVRERIDRFDPDVVVVWGDDQHENFHADLIPPFAVLAYDDLKIQPWKHNKDASAMGGKPNAWGEPTDTTRVVRGAPRFGRELTTSLLEAGIDMAYAYRPLHHPSLSHAFLNTVLYLDYDRIGWNYPTLPIAINCYGRKVVAAKGFLTHFDADLNLDPPGPRPDRVMSMGAAVAEAARESDLRVALVASSSWSHAFLCDKTYRLRPDTAADHRLYEALVADDTEPWRSLTTDQVEESGQQELLNWCALMGAVEALDASVAWSTFVETDLFNSNKVFATWEPV